MFHNLMSRIGRTFIASLFILASSASCPATAHAQVMYTLIDLGTLNGVDSFARGINSSGQATGFARVAGGNFHAFRTMPGGTLADPGVDLGTLGGSSSRGWGINASGQVVGDSTTAGNVATHAFRTAPGGLVNSPGTDLGTLGGQNSFASAINASGQVTGSSDIVAGVRRAFRTTATGTLSTPGADIGTLFPTGDSFGVAINASGQVGGYSSLGSVSLAFRTTPTGRVDDPGTNLGGLGGTSSRVEGINDAGQVVGTADLPGNTVRHAFRTSATGLISDPGTDLGTLPGLTDSWALAINNSGVVVGNSFSGSLNRAFIYDTQMRDLNDLIAPGSGLILTVAYEINDAGWITGSATVGVSGPTHGFVLIPIPEPSSLALGGLAVVGGWIVRRRRAGRVNAPVELRTPERLHAPLATGESRVDPDN